MKIRDIKESKQINELDLSSFIGDRGAAGVKSGLASLTGDATGNQSTEDRMAMDLFLKKFIGNAAASVEQAVKSGLVAKGATAPATASAAQPNASAGTSAPAATTAPQTTAQSPEQIRKQKQAAAGAVAQQQMATNPVQAKAAPAVAQSPEQIRQQKQAAAAKAAQGQMAPVSKLPANQPTVQASNIRQQKQAAAAANIQGQEAPFSKVSPAPAVWSNKRNPNASPRSPIAKQQPAAPVAQSAPANKQPPGFNAQNIMKMSGMQNKAVKKVPAMAENAKFQQLNNLFESMVQEAGQQSISQYIMGFFKKFMTNVDPKALQSSLPQAEALAKEAEASYPKMNVPLTKLAQLGWSVSNQQGSDEPAAARSQGAATSPAMASQASTSATTPSGQPSTPQQTKTVYTQVKGMLDKLDKKGKQRIIAALEKQLGSAPVAKPASTSAVKQAPVKTTNEPISIGGQKINPNDPLYAKMQKQMAGK